MAWNRLFLVVILRYFVGDAGRMPGVDTEDNEIKTPREKWGNDDQNMLCLCTR